MTSLIIRPYSPADLESCRMLWVELTQRHREIYEDPTIGGDDPGRYFDQHLAQVGAERIWVAECAGQVVGLFGLIVQEEQEQAEVEPVVVGSAYRGQGIGRELLQRAIAEAAALGVRFLSIKAVARNVEVIRFYYQVGFRTLGEIEMFMELRPAEFSSWKPGPEIFGCAFDY